MAWVEGKAWRRVHIICPLYRDFIANENEENVPYIVKMKSDAPKDQDKNKISVSSIYFLEALDCS